MRFGGILAWHVSAMCSLAGAWTVIALWVLPIVFADTQSYRYVKIDECKLNTAKVEEIDASAGTITVNIRQTGDAVANCTVTLSAPDDKRIAFVFADQTFYFPVQNADCRYGSLVLNDPTAGKKLTSPKMLCGEVLESDTPPDWMKPYHTEGNTLQLIISHTTIQGDIRFVLKYVIFTDKEDDSCFVCQDNLNGDVSMCIDNSLTCDRVQNCFAGSDEDYRFTRRYSSCGNPDRSCPFRCSGRSDDEIRGDEACDGRRDCRDGSDESDEVCVVSKSKPFSTLSVVDIVVSILCAIILVVLSIVCLYCYCCPPPPKRYRKAYKRAQKEAARARAQAAIDGQPAGNAQQV